MPTFDLAVLFDAELPHLPQLADGARDVGEVAPWRLCRDRFAQAECLFLQGAAADGQGLALSLAGDYRVSACAAGGWLILPGNGGDHAFWIPQAPRWRRYDPEGRILAEQEAGLAELAVSPASLTVGFAAVADHVLDWVIWRLPGASDWIAQLERPTTLESQAYYLWGSHTVYQRPADLYQHLIAGRVYERGYAWPLKRRICSENDAHALHVTLDGLGLATGRSFYSVLCRQLLLCVIARQSADGGFRHGEWTLQMEAHFRLNASAMHLFLDALQARPDPAVLAAAGRLASYLANTRDEMAVGAWFLHDDLERSPEAMDRAPFKWFPSRVLGKSPSNMLVINTHMDTSIALDRYARVSGDARHQPLVESGRASIRAVLDLRPAEWLYRPLFRAIALTLLPTQQAMRLPLPLRALKRVAWKYLLPNLYRVKLWFPRLVMPGGYVDRHLTLDSFAFHYLTINLMDMARYQRRLPAPGMDALIASAARFIQESGVRARWRELAYERYALGFWAEALWQLCQMYDDWRYRTWLAEAVLDLEDEAMGIPPSLLGANREALARPRACPQPPDPGVRVVSIPRAGEWEVLWVNTRAQAAAAPAWAAAQWRDAVGETIAPPARLPARQFVASYAAASNEA